MRRGTAILVSALLAAGCGGGGSTPTATVTPPTSGGGDPAKLVVLDSGSFDGLVLSAPRPSLVKFQSPT